jgi:poly-gamma-glutamate capsule biosynthesis protein CapA/YwtB (metallophosphatase superfamily)
MSDDVEGRFHPVSMPRDARAYMKFTGEMARSIDQRVAQAADGRWDSTVDVRLDPTLPDSLAHWLYKSINPVTRCMQGGAIDVEKLLLPFKATTFDLLPLGSDADPVKTMSVSGDLMSTPGIEGAAEHLFHSVDDLIFGVDIAYANLESTLTNGDVAPTEFSAESTPKINLTPAQYETVTSHNGRRFDVLHLANNHILDCGEEGVRTTLARLAQDGTAQVGVNSTLDEALAPRITEHSDLRIGWVAHTFSVNFKPFPEGKPWMVNMTPFHLEADPDTSAIEAQVRACRDAGCDLVFVALHWGLEFELYPHPQQVEWAHRFAEAGADAVIGHHPHVPQPVEIYRPVSGPDRAVPILYSLGNLSTLMSHPAMALSLVARFSITGGACGEAGSARLAKLELTPVALVAERTDGREISRLVPLEVLDRTVSQGAMRSYIDEMGRYADLVVGDTWRSKTTKS